MEDGRLTDAQGRRVDFKNAIIVMTSNVGARNITEKRQKLGFAFGDADTAESEQLKTSVMDELKLTFRPEFLNRVDDTIVFDKLTRENIRDISLGMLKTVAERVAAMGITMTFDDAAVDLLAERGFDPIYGARPLRRAIQSAVEDLTAERMLEGTLKSGDAVTVTARDGKIEFSGADEKERETANV
jgi:ATP-dependent Clp protease ATP-binding subunit ClpC